MLVWALNAFIYIFYTPTDGEGTNGAWVGARQDDAGRWQWVDGHHTCLETEDGECWETTPVTSADTCAKLPWHSEFDSDGTVSKLTPTGCDYENSYVCQKVPGR